MNGASSWTSPGWRTTRSTRSRKSGPFSPYAGAGEHRIDPVTTLERHIGGARGRPGPEADAIAATGRKLTFDDAVAVALD